MPKGYPKSDGQKIGDRFDKAYRRMKREKKEEKAEKLAAKEKGECSCGKK